MYEFEEHRTADAPIETCWRVLTDPDLAADWVPFISSARAEGDPGPGRRLYVRASMLGISARAEQVVDVWEPPHAYGWTGQEPFPTRLRVRLDETDASATEIHAAVSADPGGFVPFGRGLVSRTAGRQFARSADALVELAEREA